jgi:hypothetical protein
MEDAGRVPPFPHLVEAPEMLVADEPRRTSCEVLWKRTTTPKKPGPAPRAAQKRSAFSSALAWTSSPDATTTSTPVTLMHAGPTAREFHPKPPWSRNPPRDGPMQWPVGKNRSFSSAL